VNGVAVISYTAVTRVRKGVEKDEIFSSFLAALPIFLGAGISLAAYVDVQAGFQNNSFAASRTAVSQSFSS
jgi:hypothetical protein